MKRVLLTLLALILVVAVIGTAGFVGYQYGIRQGASFSANGNPQLPPGHPDINGDGMRSFGFDRGFGHGLGFNMMHRGMGFGFFWPLMFLGRILFWVLLIAAVYWLLTRSGWRLTRTTPPPTVAKTTSTTTTVENREDV